MFEKGSAAKRHRQSLKRRTRNRSVRSRVRNEVKSFMEACESKDAGKAALALKTFTRVIDSAAQKGVYHKATAARKKSRLHKKLNSL